MFVQYGILIFHKRRHKTGMGTKHPFICIRQAQDAFSAFDDQSPSHASLGDIETSFLDAIRRLDKNTSGTGRHPGRMGRRGKGGLFLVFSVLVFISGGTPPKKHARWPNRPPVQYGAIELGGDEGEKFILSAGWGTAV